jgi:steroid delta-isomerase-like uncharacterized protein
VFSAQSQYGPAPTGSAAIPPGPAIRAQPQYPLKESTIVKASTPSQYAALLVSLVIAFAAFAAHADTTPDAARNKTVAKRVIEERLASGNTQLDHELFTPDFVVNMGPRKATLKQDQDSVSGWKAAFPDMSTTVNDVVAEGDRVVVRWTVRGTNTGKGNGLPATGKKIEVSGFSIFRMADGRIAESWGMFDTFGLFRQLGLTENPLGKS